MRTKSGRPPLNVARAIEMRDRQRLTWSEIGRRLAREDGRRVSYQARSVMRAVQQYREGKR